MTLMSTKLRRTIVRAVLIAVLASAPFVPGCGCPKYGDITRGYYHDPKVVAQDVTWTDPETGQALKVTKVRSDALGDEQMQYRMTHPGTTVPSFIVVWQEDFVHPVTGQVYKGVWRRNWREDIYPVDQFFSPETKKWQSIWYAELKTK